MVVLNVVYAILTMSLRCEESIALSVGLDVAWRRSYFGLSQFPTSPPERFHESLRDLGCRFGWFEDAWAWPQPEPVA